MNHAIEMPDFAQPSQAIDVISEPGLLLMSFNRTGTLLAGATASGKIIIYDFSLQTLLFSFQAYPDTAICSLSWSYCGRYLLSCSYESLKYWDVLEYGKMVAEFNILERCNGAIPVYATLHPRGKPLCLVSINLARPILVDIFAGTCEEIPVDLNLPVQASKKSKVATTHAIALCWDKTGDRALFANASGQLHLLQIPSLTLLHQMDIAQSKLGVKSLNIDHSGERLLVNALDGILRVFHVPTDNTPLFLENEIVYGVEKIDWTQVIFSTEDGCEFIAGGAYGSDHRLFLWSRPVGQVMAILEGPNEGFIGVCWHPKRSCIVSITGLGRAIIWGTESRESFAAYDPEFTEIEENEIYIEPEDEFDVDEMGVSLAKRRKVAAILQKQKDAMKEPVDILTRLPMGVDEENHLNIIPIRLTTDGSPRTIDI